MCSDTENKPRTGSCLLFGAPECDNYFESIHSTIDHIATGVCCVRIQYIRANKPEILKDLIAPPKAKIRSILEREICELLQKPVSDDRYINCRTFEDDETHHTCEFFHYLLNLLLLSGTDTPDF